MNRIKKITAAILAAAVVLGNTGTLPVKAAPDQETVKLEMSVPENKVLTYRAGESKKFTLKVKNTGTTDLTEIQITPKLGDQGDKWPFETQYQSYSARLDGLKQGEEGTVEFSFKARQNVSTARYTLTFEAKTAQSGEEAVSTQSFYVNCTAEEKKQTAQERPPVVKVSDTAGGGGTGVAYDAASTAAEAGGFDNGGAAYEGGGESASGSVPRVIVTGFTTDPEEVRAGSNFTLKIHLKNTSKATRVANMLFDLESPTEGTDEQTSAPAFLPSSGSNSIYLDGIKANGTADISIQLNAKADLVQKPYSINLNMKYEDGDAAQIEAQSSISIPVKQDARFEFSEFEIVPGSVAVGEEANVSCSLYNLGRIKLYNVKAVFEGKGIDKEELFLGNIEPGSSTAIDAMLEGTEVTQGPEEVKMTLSYEDESGSLASTEQTFQLEILEVSDDMAMMDEEMIEDEKGFPVLPVILVILALGAAAAAVIARKRKKKRQMEIEEEGLLDELDRYSEDERQ